RSHAVRGLVSCCRSDDHDALPSFPTRRSSDLRENGEELKPVIGPGPDNPLGRHAMYLGWPSYLIHGTNKPAGVGLRSSHGCIRRSEEHTSELQSRENLVCRLLLEKKKNDNKRL